MSQNIIPKLYLEGPFEAVAPFDVIVKPTAYYTVEATLTPAQMQADKKDLFALVWEPAGVTQAAYEQQLATLISVDGAIIVLSSKNSPNIYVPSNAIKSWPVTDGVVYEHICIITDCGAVPPSFKNILNSAIDHFNNYMTDNYGLTNPRTTIGTIQTRGYIPKEQAEAWENTRQQTAKENPSDLIRLNAANATIAQLTAYIAELEGLLTAKVNPDSGK